MKGAAPRVHAGDRYGRWVVLEEVEERAINGCRRFLCRCDCGQERAVIGTSLRSGDTKSCGCLLRETAAARGAANATHRREPWTTYVSWSGMLGRCRNPRNPKWAHYGGRGITVCDRWLTFENFAADMGVRPSHLTLDRIDVDGNYEPSNCRWADGHLQRCNQRRMVAA